VSNAFFHFVHERIRLLILPSLALPRLRLLRQLPNLDTLLAKYARDALFLRQQPVPLILRFQYVMVAI
jgi:hypothetical protein